MHRHPLAQVAYIASILIVLHTAVDVLAGGFPGVVPLRAFKQAITD